VIVDPARLRLRQGQAASSRPLDDASTMRFLLLCTALLAGLPSTLHAQLMTTVIDPEQSTLSYTGHHLLHDWTGTSEQVTGTLTFDPDAPHASRITVRVPVQSFDSGNVLRDSAMLERVHAAAFPEVTFVSESVTVHTWMGTTRGYIGRWTVHGWLSFHGRTHRVDVDAEVNITDGRFRAECTFAASLRQFRVKRPWVLFIPSRDTIDLNATIYATLPLVTAGY
jgi:polyisoprenoid-binding protein YceI